MYCIYVDVVTLMSATGEKIPKAIIWSDGKTYPIRDVEVVGNQISLGGKSGIRHIVHIGRHERSLYYDSLSHRWFIDQE